MASRSGCAALFAFGASLAISSLAAPLDGARGSAAARVAGAPAEVVFAVDDLRAVTRRARARLERKAGVAAVDRYLRADGEPSGLDLNARIDAWSDLLHPGGAAVPFSMAGGLGEAGPWFVATFSASPGVLERLATAQPVPGVELKLEDNRLRFDNEAGVPVWAAYGKGHLRIWVGPPELALDATGVDLSGPATDLERAWAVLRYDGRGALGDLMRSRATDETDTLLARTREITLTLTSADEKTDAMRLSIDHPQLGPLAPMLANGGLPPDTLPLFGPEATSVLSLALPPGLVQQGLLSLPALPPELNAAASQLDGRIGLAFFGSSSDWAISLGITSPEAAARAVPAVKKALIDAAPGLKKGLSTVSEGRISLRTGPDLAGYDLRASEDQLVLGSQAQRELRPTRPFPHTPRMADLLDTPAVLTGYFVSGQDPGLIEIYSLAGSALGWFPDLREEIPPDFRPFFDGFLDGWADAILLAEAQTFFLYDLGLSVQIGGSFLVIEAVSSEL